jgi:hypothetical protein
MESTKALKASAWRRALLVAGIGIISAGSVAGVSFALTSSSGGSPASHVASNTPSSSTGSGANANGVLRKAKVRQLLRHAVHGDLELATKNGFVTIEFDRGAVTSISTSSISVLRADSQTVTDAITGTTHMPKRGVPTQGQQVVVISKGGDALYIFDVGALASVKSGTSTNS